MEACASWRLRMLRAANDADAPPRSQPAGPSAHQLINALRARMAEYCCHPRSGNSPARSRGGYCVTSISRTDQGSHAATGSPLHHTGYNKNISIVPGWGRPLGPVPEVPGRCFRTRCRPQREWNRCLEPQGPRHPTERRRRVPIPAARRRLRVPCPVEKLPGWLLFHLVRRARRSPGWF